MSKNTKFSGKPIISQIIEYFDRSKINRTAKLNKSDNYYKKFKTYEHLISMSYLVLSGCTSIRELSSIMLACEGKINHLGIDYFPKRSTISDANRKRSSKVFIDIYYDLYNQYSKFLSDSSLKKVKVENLKIIDSTTISLFSQILKGAGRNKIDGTKKGGMKVHTMINAVEDVPCLVRFSSAATHDHEFLKNLELKKGSIVVFDKGYNDYDKYLEWTNDGIDFVTRQKENASYQSIEEYDIPETVDNGILKDEVILVRKDDKEIRLRRIAYWHQQQKKVYEFITNNHDLEADEIAEIYKRRWQIELLFKRLKQNFPLKYFIGESQNAIEIQILVSLIIQLIMLIIKIKVEKKRKWAFSNLMTVVRFHLMTYINLTKFLISPEYEWEKLTDLPQNQTYLFDGS